MPSETKRLRSPSRKREWSSTSKTRRGKSDMVGSFHGDTHHQFRAQPRGGLQDEAASHFLSALTHYAQTEMLLHSRRGHIGIKSPAIVVDDDMRPATFQ